MILEKNWTFSTDQAVTASAISSDLIDMKDLVRDLGTGARPLMVVSQVTTAFTDGGSDSTIVPTLRVATTAAGVAAGTDVLTLGTFAALSAIGTRLTAVIPPGILDTYRFAGIYFTVANGNLTTGKLTSFVTPDIQKWTALPKGYTGPTTS